jgi:hypothetical protein
VRRAIAAVQRSSTHYGNLHRLYPVAFILDTISVATLGYLAASVLNTARAEY